MNTNVSLASTNACSRPSQTQFLKNVHHIPQKSVFVCFQVFCALRIFMSASDIFKVHSNGIEYFWEVTRHCESFFSFFSFIIIWTFCFDTISSSFLNSHALFKLFLIIQLILWASLKCINIKDRLMPKSMSKLLLVSLSCGQRGSIFAN